MNSKKNPSNAPGGESSADYIISESGEHEQTSTKGKKSGLESVTDTLKEKVIPIEKALNCTVRFVDIIPDFTHYYCPSFLFP